MRRRLAAIAGTVLLVGLVAGTAPASAQVYTAAEGVEYEVLTNDTKDPLFIQVAQDGRIFWVEREGRIEVLHPDGRQDNVGHVPVSANACDEAYCPAEALPLEEGGLYSILLAPDFTESGEVYLFRSVPDSVRLGESGAIPGNAWRNETVCFEPTCETADDFGVWRLSRFTLDVDSHLLPASEETIFEVPAEWIRCCHYGGNLEWLPDGTILLSTGDDMAATAGAYGQSTNPAEGNAEQTSMNPADRRGKVLRLNPDGSVPDGSVDGVVANPFLVTDNNGVAQRDANGRLITEEADHPSIPDTWGPEDGKIAFDPYVYTLGYKQPFRGTVHPYTGAAIFGEVGPDGFAPFPGRGPRGMEELNEIPPGGGVNHGWPRCAGNNEPYYPYDGIEGAPKLPFVGGVFVPGQPFDCSAMEPATLWYPHDVSERWPSMGSGGVTSVPAAFYRADNAGPLRLPPAFNDNLIFMEESRSGIIGMPVNADGTLVTDERQWTFVFPPTGSPASLTADRDATAPSAPIDATVGPDGAIYFVEYGDAFYNGAGGAISRLKCTGCTDALSQSLAAAGSTAQASAAPASGPIAALRPVAVLGLLALGTWALRRRGLV